jgi:hypothetical protein
MALGLVVTSVLGNPTALERAPFRVPQAFQELLAQVQPQARVPLPGPEWPQAQAPLPEPEWLREQPALPQEQV